MDKKFLKMKGGLVNASDKEANWGLGRQGILY
jgi:hypothetical protein